MGFLGGMFAIILFGIIVAGAAQTIVENRTSDAPLNEGDIVAIKKEQDEFDKQVQLNIKNELEDEAKKDINLKRVKPTEEETNELKK